MALLLVQRDFSGEVSITGGEWWPWLGFWFASPVRKRERGDSNESYAVSSTLGEGYLTFPSRRTVAAWPQGRGMAVPMLCPSCHSEGEDTFAENPLGYFLKLNFGPFCF